MQEVPHHMLDYMSPGQATTVTIFRDRALPIIEDLLSRSKVPVVAGGTCYYVESLLWKVLLDPIQPHRPDDGVSPAKRARRSSAEESSESDSAECSRVREVLTEVFGSHNQSLLLSDGLEGLDLDVLECMSNEDKQKLHGALQDVDPERANVLHPNNFRKVLRSLQVFVQTGRRHSDIIHEQKTDGNPLGGPLRYSNSVILWVTCQQKVLDDRLDARVDMMISQGLIQELEDFHKNYNIQRIKDKDGKLKSSTYTLGVFQSIGFKEFHDYLMLSEEKRRSEGGKEEFEKGVQLMKIATRQYARRQLKWIRKRFLGRSRGQVPPVYTLDGTDVSQWDSSVQDKAFSIVQSVLDNTPCPVEPEPSLSSTSVRDHTLEKCEPCNRLFCGSQQLAVHLKSEKHRRQLQRLARLSQDQKVQQCKKSSCDSELLVQCVKSDKHK